MTAPPVPVLQQVSSQQLLWRWNRPQIRSFRLGWQQLSQALHWEARQQVVLQLVVGQQVLAPAQPQRLRWW
jgi:hypothetical protein